MIHVIYVLKPKCTCELPGNHLAMWGGGPRFCISNKLSGNLSGTTGSSEIQALPGNEAERLEENEAGGPCE